MTKVLRKGVIYFALAMLVMAQTAHAGGGAPQVISVNVNPADINPKTGESANITFELNNVASNYTVEILQEPNYTVVKTLASNISAPTGGVNSATWDGKKTSGSVAEEGIYIIKVTAKNSAGESSNWTTVNVDYPAASPGDTVPIISAISSTPKTFNPKAPASTSIKFHLNKAANYSVDILKSGAPVATVTPGKAAVSAGDYLEIWNGKDSAGTNVSEGAYLVRVMASNSAGQAATAYTIVYVDYPAAPVGPVCGNAVCEMGETAASCATDCPIAGPVCGNAVCESGETGASCATDCGTTPVPNAPVVSNDYAFPNPFDPNTQKTKIYYTLNTGAKITVTVLSGADTKTLKSTQQEGPGTYYVEWDGKNNAGGVMVDGSHLYKVIAQNDDGYDVELGTVDTKVAGTTPLPGGFPELSNVTVTPYLFDPLVTETKICYSINTDVNMSVAVLDGDVQVKKVIDNVSRAAGTYCEQWNGKSTSGSYANSGTYAVKLYASNSTGYDIELASVQVNLAQQYTPNTAPDIKDVTIQPDPFNPAVEKEAIIYYQIDKTAKINVTIEDVKGVMKKTLVNGIEKPQGTNLVKWYGEDKFGNPIPQGEYKIRVEAWNVYGLDIYIRKFLLGAPGIIVITGGKTCAGFLDVPANSAYCDAITQMKTMGIFGGYEDGTFRPSQPINRAETVKVILLALNKAILSDDGTSVGFLDIPPLAWFNKYLRTARVHNIIQGYPDGTFRAASTVNRAELLKIFLEATLIPLPGCYGQPYPDIPQDNPWYLKYACFAKQYNLINPDGYGNMHPATPMTRGDVADLFFRFQSQGLFNVFPN